VRRYTKRKGTDSAWWDRINGGNATTATATAGVNGWDVDVRGKRPVNGGEDPRAAMALGGLYVFDAASGYD